MKFKQSTNKISLTKFTTTLVLIELVVGLIISHHPLIGMAQETILPAATSTANKIHRTCPVNLPSGPSAGKDSIGEIAGSITNQYPTDGTDDSLIGETANLPALSGISNKVAQIAMSQVGHQYLGDVSPYGPKGQWCAYFVTWAMRKAGLNIPSIGNSKATLRWFKSNGHSVFKDPAQAGAGDVVVWDRGGSQGHIGLIITNDTANQKLGIVEGNTSRDYVKYYTYTYQQVKNKQKGLVGFGRW
jgi:hypothetical protein